MNRGYSPQDGKPAVVDPGTVNLGLAIDLPKPDGTRQLLVPNIKHADDLDFGQFMATYEDVVRRARNNKLTPDDFAGTTISLTNPGTIGTVHSVPRLMVGQGVIVGVGAMDYPAEFQGASDEQLARLGVSKVLTLTSTYDHRIIQGAHSGEFLRVIGGKLLGEGGFYDRVFAALRIPYEPVRWVRDNTVDTDTELAKPARIAELIHAYRSRGHFMAETDPLAYRQRRHPDLDIQNHGLTLWDLDRVFPTAGFGGKTKDTLRNILGLLRDSYCRSVGAEYMHLQDPRQRRWLQERLEAGYARTPREDQLRILRKLNQAEAFETFLQTKYVGQKRFSLEGGESLIPLLDAVVSRAAESGLDEVAIGMSHRGRLNVLANLAGKSISQIFAEFEGSTDPRSVQGSGDVKYHLGTEGTFTTESGASTNVYLAANPSHLEAVDPVLEGIVRAKQDRIDLGGDGFSVLPDAHPRRRRVRRSGRGLRDAQHLPAARLPHRRHGARDRQQPGRLHHRAVVVAVHALRDRRGQGPAGADLPRQRRRPGGLRAGRRARVRVPRAVRPRRGHRHDLLPASRPQRGRRPVDDPAADVQPHRGQALDPQAVHRGAGQPRRHHRRRGVRGPGALPGRARAGLRRDPRGLHPRPRRRAGRGSGEARVPAGGRGHDGRLAHRRRRRRAGPDRPGARASAGGLHGPPEARQAARDPRAHVPRGQHRLGLRRAARLRLAAHRGHSGAPGRPGQPARHVRPAARGAARPGHRRRVDPAAVPVRGPGQVLGLRLLALGVRGDGLRVRLLRRAARRPGAVGGAVRRLRERRADDRRRVHLLRGAEVGAALLGGPAAAARVRGPGSRPLLGADRAVPAAVRPSRT